VFADSQNWLFVMCFNAIYFVKACLIIR